MTWATGTFEKGDIIRVRLGSIYHYGIFVSEEEVIAFGLPPTAENIKKQGEVTVLSTDVDVFSCALIPEKAVLSLREKLMRNPPEKTVEIARSRLGEKGYNIIHNNCEHFVNEVVFNKKQSAQEELARKKWQKFIEK